MTYSRTAWLAAMALSFAAAAPSHAASPDAKLYIVKLADAPSATYEGNVAGFAATKPPKGQRLNVTAANVQAYTSYLAGKQANVISSLGQTQVTQRFNVVYNGFSAMLTERQAAQLQSTPGVSSVNRSGVVKISTSHTAEFLGLSKPGGLWSQVGGKGAAGEDVIVAVLDTGFSPENPAFTDLADPDGTPNLNGSVRAYGPPPARWKGGPCQTFQSLPATACNNKVLTARVYVDGAKAQGFFDPTDEVESPRDMHGHGSHTASTAAGNSGVKVASALGGLPGGVVSGMAPRARLAIYKVCTASERCSESDALAATEQAIKDGVQVISYSVGSNPYAFGPVDEAFLGATVAGVFVAAAASNDGVNNVNHVSPWLATVAAATHDRMFMANLMLGNGAAYSGAIGTTARLNNLPLALAESVMQAGADVTQARLCNDDTLDPAKAAGKVLVCDRGVLTLNVKASNVSRAGGRGMVVLNVPGEATNLYDSALFDKDGNPVPWMHLPTESRNAIRNYAAQAQATASFGASTSTYGNVVAPQLADFSSRGPNNLDPGVVKPDLTGPGVSILAAFVPRITQAEHDAIAAGAPQKPAWIYISGTSMSTPHVAGSAAVLMQRHPDWSPAAIKSALMTTAYDLKPSATVPVPTVHDQGAGFIDPTKAADPGLVFETPVSEYHRYRCTILQDCASLGLQPLMGRDINLPSISAFPVLGKLSLTRRVTNVSTSASSYQLSASAPGFNVTVSPMFLTIGPGETKEFTVNFETTTAKNNEFAFGNLQLSDGSHLVRVPVVAYPQRASALPVSITTKQSKGSILTTIGTGFNGALKTSTTPLRRETYKGSGVFGEYYGEDLQTYCGYNESVSASQFVLRQFFEVAPGTPAMVVQGPQPEDIAPGTDPSSIWTYYRYFNIADQKNQHMWFGAIGGASRLPNPRPGTWVICSTGWNGVVKEYKGIVHIHKDKGDDFLLKAAAPSQAVLGGTASMGVSWDIPTPGYHFGRIDFLWNGQTVGTTVFGAANPASGTLATEPGALRIAVPVQVGAMPPIESKAKRGGASLY